MQTLTRVQYVFLSILLMLGAIQVNAAMVAAGTRITNQAKITYFDTQYGEIRHIYSNFAVVTVGKRVATRLDVGGTIHGAPGEIINFPHMVTNIGNVSTGYTLNLEESVVDNGDYTNVDVYQDLDGNGIITVGEPKLEACSDGVPNCYQLPNLNPDETFNFVVQAQIKTGAQIGNEYTITSKVTPTTKSSSSAPSGLVSGDNTVQIGDPSKAIISLQKKVFPTCNTYINSGDSVRFTITTKNAGHGAPVEKEFDINGQTSKGVIVADELLPNMRLPNASEINEKSSLKATSPSAQAVFVLQEEGTSKWVSFDQWNGSGVLHQVGFYVPASYLEGIGNNKDFSYSVIVTSQRTSSKLFSTKAKLWSGGSSVAIESPSASCISLKAANNPPLDPNSGDGSTIDSNDARIRFKTAAYDVVSQGTQPNHKNDNDFQNAPMYFHDESKGISYDLAKHGVYIELLSSNSNKDKTKVEHYVVELKSSKGEDRVRVTVVETGENTGVFRSVRVIKLSATETGDNKLCPLSGESLVADYSKIESSCVLNAETNGSITAQFIDNGVATLQDTAPVDPLHTVFNALNNEPVAGAMVTLYNEDGSVAINPGAYVDSPEEDKPYEPFTTDADGTFQFPVLKPGKYYFDVKPPKKYSFPSTSISTSIKYTVESPSFGKSGGSSLGVASGAGLMEVSSDPAETNYHTLQTIDIPLDPDTQGMLVLEKRTTTPKAGIGDIIKYEVEIWNRTGSNLYATKLDDVLPYGFRFIKDSARLDDKRIDNPEGGEGPNLRFSVGYENDEVSPTGFGFIDSKKHILSYFVRATAGAVDSDGVNTISATSKADTTGFRVNSNTSRATVEISQEGVLLNDGIIVGRVYAPHSCTKDEEIADLPIGNVKLYLEDGSWVQSDAKGLFSLYGVKLGEHVLKVDPITLPKGAQLAASDQRHFFDGDSRWIDLKAGEIHRADFTLNCESPDVQTLVENIRTRNEGIDENANLDRLAKNTKKTTEELRSVGRDGDLSSGQEYESTSSSTKQVLSQADMVGFSLQLSAEANIEKAEREVAFLQKKVKQPVFIYERDKLHTVRTGLFLKKEELEPLQKHLKDKFGFKTTIVRTALSKAPVIIASGLGDHAEAQSIIDPEQAIKHVTRKQAKKGTWLWPKAKTNSDGRFIFITRKGLSPQLIVNGEVVSKDNLGIQIENRREKAQILAWYGVKLKPGENLVEVKAKDPFGNLRQLAKTTVIRPDKAARIVMTPQAASFYADNGESLLPVKLRVEDKDGNVVDSVYFATLIASDGSWVQPDIQSKVSGHQVRIDGGERLVHLRSSETPGDVEIKIRLDQMQAETKVAQVKPLRPLIAVGMVDVTARRLKQDSNGQAPTSNATGVQAANEIEGRTAFFMKGRVWGDKHLTLSYDSEKDADDKLFRDIDPANYYPVYGDASSRGYEAQSRSKVYAKLEKNKSSVMWGDYRTDSGNDHEDLGRTQRTLTGANAIYDDGKTRVQLFAAEVEDTHVEEEIRGNGTALNYRLKTYPIVKNSEQIELITYDRNNKGLTLKTTKLSRLENYIMDDVTGYITFHDVVPSIDDDNNPVYVRINYDVDKGNGEDNLVAGIRTESKLTDKLTVGASFTRDEDDKEGSDLAGAFATYELNSKSKVKVGIGSMDHNDPSKKDGQAARLSAEYEWTKDAHSKVTWGRAEEGFTNSSAGVSDGREELSAQHTQKINKDLQLNIEATNSKSLTSGEQNTTLGATATYNFEDWRLKGGARIIDQEKTGDNERLTTVILGAERPVEVYGKKGRINAEVEQDTGNSERQRLKLGGEIELSKKARFYANYEHINSINGIGELSSSAKNDTFTMGVKGKLTDNVDAYTEYRLRGSLDDREAEAVNGIRAKYQVEPGFSIAPTVEVVRALEGNADKDSVAVSVGVEDTRRKNVRKHARIEARDSDTSTYMGFTGSYVGRINENWTGIAREELRIDKPDNSEKKVSHELTLGAARRATKDKGKKHDMLLLYKNKEERGPNTGDDESTHIVTLHQNIKLTDNVYVSNRIGGKIQKIEVDDNTYKNDAVLADMRVIWDVSDRVSLDVHGGVLATDGASERQYSAGVGVSYLLRKNLRLGLDYNLRGFKDDDLDEQGYNTKGPSIKLQYKFDEKDLQRFFE